MPEPIDAPVRAEIVEHPATNAAEPSQRRRSAPSPLPNPSRLSPLETAPTAKRDPITEAATALSRIHIGTIEVRTTPPPPPAAPPVPAPAASAPRAATAGRIGQAYAWRFGLAQG
jgi:hypothetical protein